MNEKILPNFYGTSSRIVLFLFWGEFEDTKKTFQNQLTFSKTSPAMYERAKVGISWEMLSCFLLGLTIYLFSDGSGDSNGSGYLDGSGDLDSSGNSDGSGYLDGSEDLDDSGDSDGSGDSDEVGKSTKLAQFLFKIY